MHIKDPLMLIEKSSPCGGGSGFPLRHVSGLLPYPMAYVQIKCVECIIR